MATPLPRSSAESARSPATSRGPVQGYPFPSQDSPYRQASAIRAIGRKGSAASLQSTNSIGGSLDLRSTRTLRESNENAISTLLQPPIVRTGLLPHTAASAAASGFKLPTSRDIPPVTLTNIPHVPVENFQHYLTTIGPLIETFERSRADAEPTSWLKKDKELDRTDRFAQALERRLSRDGSLSPSLSRRASNAILSPPETPTTPRFGRRSSGQVRRNRNEPPPLSTIPVVYFDDDFHLEDPRTFDVVSEQAEIVRGITAEDKPSNGSAVTPRKNLASNAILQEKLSWYMDTVEIHLISSISTASPGFFAALGSLKELQSEAEESVAKIQSLRNDLRRLDQEVAVGGLDVAARRRRRHNVQKLQDATAQVGQIIDAVKRSDQLVEEKKYDDAMDEMDKVGHLVKGEHNGSMDLSSLQALQGLQSGMQELSIRIGAGFTQNFTTTLITDLRQHVAKIPAQDTLKRWCRQKDIPPTYMESSQEFRADLLASLSGLAKCGHTAPAIATYREAAMREMKTIIRHYLPSSSDDDADSMISTSTRGGKGLTQQEKSSILARNLRALDPEDAETLLMKIYTSISEALRRLSAQVKILLDMTSMMQPPASRDQSTSSQDEVTQALDITSLLGQAVDTAHTQLSRVLKVRNEQSIRLTKPQFLRYFNLNRLFADECEAVSGSGGQTLKGVINAQVSGFVQVSGQAETEKIVSVLDTEKWDAVDLPEPAEALLARVLGSVERDAPEWTANTPIWEPPPTENVKPLSTNGTSTPVTNGASTPKPQIKPAVIDGNRYILVNAAVALLTPVDNFLALTCSLPSLTPQISSALLEVLRNFNSRSSQLILGAGATRSAGLKNITTKHLALSSQALSFIVALIPYQRECIRRHLSGATSAPGQAVLAEWDKTKRLFQEHQVGIHEKLVEIMTGRSQTHVKSMLSLDLESTAADAAGEGKPSPYMETLIKETLTLHRVLARHLSELDVSMIMRQIFANYDMQWSKALADVTLHRKESELRLLRDVTALNERLGKVTEFKEIGPKLVTIVKNKASMKSENEEKSSETEGEPMFEQPADGVGGDEALSDERGEGEAATSMT